MWDFIHLSSKSESACTSFCKISSSTTQKCEMRDALTGYKGLVGILLSQPEIAHNICESISTCPRRVSPLAWVSVSKIYSSATQKCEIRDGGTECEGVFGILLSKVGVAQIICESIYARPRRASPHARVSISILLLLKSAKWEMHSLNMKESSEYYYPKWRLFRKYVRVYPLVFEERVRFPEFL